MTTPACSISLPQAFRTADFFEFHQRDPQAFAEKVEGQTLLKGLTWAGQPACLTIRIRDGCADAALLIDGTPSVAEPGALELMVRRMLGLTQPVEEFEQAYHAHPQLGHLIARHPGLRVPLSASPFEALTWAVTGQQISMSAAISLRRKLIQAAGIKHSGGLACYPGAGQIASLDIAALRLAGLSQIKAQSLMTLSQMTLENTLPLNDWLMGTASPDEIRGKLLSVRGIGPWTVNYALLRGFGWLDGSLHGDAAVRRGMQVLLGHSEKITEAQAQIWLAPFSPWRALVAAHLWALLTRTNRDNDPPPDSAGITLV